MKYYLNNPLANNGIKPEMQAADGWNGQYGQICACRADFSGLEPWPESVGIVTEAGELIRFDLK